MSPQLIDRVRIDKGATIAFSALPDRHVALDGYVQGPAIDAARRRFSFDHHAGCVRHATLSTCEMVHDAISVGLDPSDLTICVNDLDSDTVLATWLLLRPQATATRRVAAAVRSAGRRDALGPAVGEGLCPALRWALAPMRLRAADLRLLDAAAWFEILAACLERLDAWCAAGAPRSHPEMRPAREPRRPTRLIHDGGTWQLVRGSGVADFDRLYAAGLRAGVVARPLANGTWEYTVGKASEFVQDFDVVEILAALARAERRSNPAQADDRTWGGGSTIGGSPRNADGTASRLSPDEVAAVVADVVAARR